MADEATFISLIVAQARVDQLMAYALDNAHPGRQLQSMRELTDLVQREEVVQEAARDSHMARSLTTLLASTSDSSTLDAISALLAALSGSSVHTSRLVSCSYGAGIVVKVSECALKEGVGSRLWGISHTFNLFLIEKLAQFINGASVLELGSGVGSTGVVAALLGARQVTATDLSEPLLRNLLTTVRANLSSSDTASNSTVQIDTLEALGYGASPCDADGLCGDLDFSDADSVSDEGELFGVEPLSERVPGPIEPHSSNHGASRGLQQGASSFQQWDVSSVRVRALDWKQEYDRYVQAHGEPVLPHTPELRCDVARTDVDETTSALDSVQMGTDVSAQQGDDRDTFDRPSTPSGDMPPAVVPSSTFEVVLGCEVLYEAPHAHWVAATIKLRLQQGGHAWIAGAVRDNKVYDAFDLHLKAVGLTFDWQQIHPAAGYQGLGNKEATYEGGYRLYSIRHAEALATAASES